MVIKSDDKGFRKYILEPFFTDHIPKGHDEQFFIPQNKPGFHIGAFMDHSLTNIFALETGLMLETKGSKVKANKIGGTTGEAVTNIWYLDIPINLKAFYDLGLANIQSGGDSDNFVKNRVFKISVGLMLGK